MPEFIWQLWLTSILQVTYSQSRVGIGDEGVVVVESSILGFWEISLFFSCSVVFSFGSIFFSCVSVFFRFTVEGHKFPHVQLVCHFLTNHGISFGNHVSGVPTSIAEPRDPFGAFLGVIQTTMIRCF